MNPNELKPIKFIYKTKEHLFYTCESNQLESFLNQVKIHFNIASNTDIQLIDTDKNITLCPVLTSHLWFDTTKQIPVYEIRTRKCKKNFLFRRYFTF